VRNSSHDRNPESARTVINWEAIVVDDASHDDTAEFVSRRASSDPGNKLFEGDVGGCATPRQQCLEAATGELLAYLDDGNLIAD